jgi:hypothetical protein
MVYRLSEKTRAAILEDWVANTQPRTAPDAAQRAYPR